jgi:hypothetical protein
MGKKIGFRYWVLVFRKKLNIQNSKLIYYSLTLQLSNSCVFVSLFLNKIIIRDVGWLCG